MIGSLIGAGLGAAASIYGGLKAKQAAKKANNMLAKELNYAQAWYDRRYNEDATQRADAQRIINDAWERLKSVNRHAAGTAAVMGGTDESVAAVKAASAKTAADISAQVAAAGAARKDQIENQYQSQRGALTQQQYANQLGVAQNVANATANAANSLMAAGASVDELREADKNRELIEKLYGG